MIASLLENYSLGEVRSFKKIPTGLIHETYKVETSEGDFILQRQHDIFSYKTVVDVDVVSRELMKRRLLAQTVVQTKIGKLYVEAHGGVWRLLTYIPGEVYKIVQNTQVAREAGKVLGQFHYALIDFDYTFESARSLHHNTTEHLRLFEKAIDDTQRDIATEVAVIRENLPALLLPKELRKTITHGDPKITNIIFQNKKAVAMIDTDDVGREHSPLIDLGDAFRSWCGGAEDNPDNCFDLALFESGFGGYQEGSGALLTKEECRLVPQAIQLIALELASRFLRDYVEDSYFGWDNTRYPSRKAHNLARAKGQIALYQDVVKQAKKMQQIVS